MIRRSFGIGKGLCLFPVLLFSLGSCIHAPPSSKKSAPDAEAVFRYLSEAKTPCLGMVKNFCQNLYAPGNLGRLEIPLSSEILEVKRGNTENDFSQVYYEYAQTQLRHRDKLPKEFQAVLAQSSYFSKLREYLARKPRREMSVEDRVYVMRLAARIDGIWDTSINETVLTRMEKKFPGYSRMSEDTIPVELKNESKRVRGVLISEIARAIWTDHPNWKEVERRFEQVREAYAAVIQAHPDIPDDVKSDWLLRLLTVRLMIPGGDPEVEMHGCSVTEANAYYYTKRNYITVCAGDFNAEDMTQTLAHEMGHALDVSRSLVLHETNSELGAQLRDLKKSACGGTPYIGEEWDRFKQQVPQWTKALATFEPQLRRLNACSKPRDTKHGLTDDYIERIARESVQDTISGLAENHVFLRVISQHLPLPDGTTRPNPAYLNPCAYYLWEETTPPYDEGMTLLLFFTAEYGLTAALPADQRFQNAIEVARLLQEKIVAARIRNEGEFSGRWRLNADGFASSPVERFSDTLGGLVFAHVLKEEPELAKRRAMYLANTAWLCMKPSLGHLMPREAAILRKYYAEPHSEGSIRQQELLSSPIREALQCEPDFENKKECRL